MGDYRLRRTIRKKLADEPDVNVAVKHGVVTLTGHVNNSAEEAEAVAAARGVKGVRTVVDEIDVTVGFGEAIACGFAKCIDFSGRAIRQEYWLWVVFASLGMVATQVLDAAIIIHEPDKLMLGEWYGLSPFYSPLNFVFIAALLLPSLAIAVRRLHDVDRTGWWLLLAPTGFGIFLLLYWHGQRGTPGLNRFGPDPLDGGPFERRPAARLSNG